MATGKATHDPIALFQQLLSQAQQLPKERMPEPTALTLATVGADGQPSARMVLLKHADADGFVFYTNLESRKARELKANSRAAMCFHWAPLERQVRVEGRVKPVTDAEADAYFASRPRGSQLGAWASKQSSVLADPAELEKRVAELDKKYAGANVPRPPFWSGFRLVPSVIEIWHGKPSRLHERQLFERDGAGWRVTRLYP
jgi:pyridoxamine 5'-phosphate oxidase